MILTFYEVYLLKKAVVKHRWFSNMLTVLETGGKKRTRFSLPTLMREKHTKHTTVEVGRDL